MPWGNWMTRALIHIFSAGAGYSCWSVSMCIVQLFFVERQAFSVAVCMVGLSVGALFWSNFAHFTIAEYGYRGALLLMAGVNLHGFVIAALFRAPNFEKKMELDTKSRGRYLVCRADDNPSTEMKNVERCQVLNIELDHNGEANRQYSEAIEDGKHALNENNDSVSASESAMLERNRTLGKAVCNHGSSSVDDDNMENISLCTSEPHLSLKRRECHINTNIGQIMVNDTKPELHTNCQKVCDILGNVIDLSLLKIPTFGLFCLSIFLGQSGNFVPFNFIPVRANAIGISKDSAAMLITYIGIGGAFGRILAGWVGDQPWADRKLMYACSHTVTGCISFITYFTSNYNLLIAYCALFAITSGMGSEKCGLIDWLALVFFNVSETIQK